MNKLFLNFETSNVLDWNLKNTSLEWQSSDSHKDSVLMVDLKNSKQFDEIQERLNHTPYAYLVTNRFGLDLTKLKNVIIVNSNDWEEIQKKLCDHFYPLIKPKKFVGITGTNGKTTTADLCLQMSHLLGFKSISVGTLGIRTYQKTVHDFSLTTPNYIEFRKRLYLFQDEFDYCFLELSSHALEQKRIHHIELECAAWTSFSQDHLDYHKTMEEYFESKVKILSLIKPTGACFVVEDDLYKKLAKHHQVQLINTVNHSELPLFFKADYNLKNLSQAESILRSLGMDVEKVPWEKLLPPPGRFNIIPYKNNYIVIDFAHTADAIENICQAVRKNFPDKKLKIIFGCGGDRDRTKRSKMGDVADKYCDYIYVTSDNPRSEEPMQIIEDVLKGIKNQNKVSVDPDRKLTVAKAIKELNNDVLLIAGKGHENYIHIGAIKHPYSDESEVYKNIGNL